MDSKAASCRRGTLPAKYGSVPCTFTPKLAELPYFGFLLVMMILFSYHLSTCRALLVEVFIFPPEHRAQSTSLQRDYRVHISPFAWDEHCTDYRVHISLFAWDGRLTAHSLESRPIGAGVLYPTYGTHVRNEFKKKKK